MNSEHEPGVEITSLDSNNSHTRRQFLARRLPGFALTTLGVVIGGGGTHELDQQALSATVKQNAELERTATTYKDERERILTLALNGQRGNPYYALEQIQKILDNQPLDSTQ